MNKHLKSKKQELLSDNITLQKCLVKQCNEALQCSKSLQSDIQILHADAVSIFPNVNKEQGGSMKNGVGSRTRHLSNVAAKWIRKELFADWMITKNKRKELFADWMITKNKINICLWKKMTMKCLMKAEYHLSNTSFVSTYTPISFLIK